MQKNWYIVYTKLQCEKKIAALFIKWKIENYCPLNCVKSNVYWRSKRVCEPLFKSYVFVYISEDQISRLMRVEGVISFLYWLGKPALIKNNEIEVIKEFANEYQDIKIERIKVDMDEAVQIIDEPSYKMEGKFISVKNKTVKVNLPSLGYTLIAKSLGYVPPVEYGFNPYSIKLEINK
jgi:transcription antitermination factor NusG